MRAPSPFSALPPLLSIPRLALKLFRGEPAISKFDWNFSATHTSSPDFSTSVGSDLHSILLELSSWTWVDHSVSGQRLRTIFALLRLAFASAPASHLNLARNQLLAGSFYKRHAVTTHVWLRLLVSTRFQVLFHSPSGVLFTFPSRY